MWLERVTCAASVSLCMVHGNTDDKEKLVFETISLSNLFTENLCMGQPRKDVDKYIHYICCCFLNTNWKPKISIAWLV